MYKYYDYTEENLAYPEGGNAEYPPIYLGQIGDFYYVAFSDDLDLSADRRFRELSNEDWLNLEPLLRGQEGGQLPQWELDDARRMLMRVVDGVLDEFQATITGGSPSYQVRFLSLANNAVKVKAAYLAGEEPDPADAAKFTLQLGVYRMGDPDYTLEQLVDAILYRYQFPTGAVLDFVEGLRAAAKLRADTETDLATLKLLRSRVLAAAENVVGRLPYLTEDAHFHQLFNDVLAEINAPVVEDDMPA